MGRKSERKVNKAVNNNKISILFDEKNIVGLQLDKNSLGKLIEDSFYLAIKRYENEKEIKAKSDKEKKKPKTILLALKLLFMPWSLGKEVVDNAYDVLLTMVISAILDLLGLLLWVSGFAIPVIRIISSGFWNEGTLKFIGMGIILIMFGSITIVSGKAFSNEKDSAKIHAFSASIFALLGCIIAIIALLK